jgi:hypothetical protein
VANENASPNEDTRAAGLLLDDDDEADEVVAHVNLGSATCGMAMVGTARRGATAEAAAGAGGDGAGALLTDDDWPDEGIAVAAAGREKLDGAETNELGKAENAGALRAPLADDADEECDDDDELAPGFAPP